VQRCATDLPIDPISVPNAALMQPGHASLTGPAYDVIKNPFREVRPDDFIHAAVGFRSDIHALQQPSGETARFVHVEDGPFKGRLRVLADASDQ